MPSSTEMSRDSPPELGGLHAWLEQARPGPARASRLGDVRLGEFGDGVHDHHRRFPDLLRASRLRGDEGGRRVGSDSPWRPRSAWSSSP